MRAAYSVKEGKGVNVSDKRKAELIDQFFGDNDQPVYPVDETLKNDVGLWADLAWAWIIRTAGRND